MMKKLILTLIFALVFTTVHALMDNPLKEGMPNTLTLSNGEVVYDLSGDWDAVLDNGGWATYEDVVKITQKDNQFVGIYLLKGDNNIGKNEEKIKGKLAGNGFEQVFLHGAKPETRKWYWLPSEGTISESGNKIVVKRDFEFKGAKGTVTFTLKKK